MSRVAFGSSWIYWLNFALPFCPSGWSVFSWVLCIAPIRCTVQCHKPMLLAPIQWAQWHFLWPPGCSPHHSFWYLWGLGFASSITSSPMLVESYPRRYIHPWTIWLCNYLWPQNLQPHWSRVMGWIGCKIHDVFKPHPSVWPSYVFHPCEPWHSLNIP